MNRRAVLTLVVFAAAASLAAQVPDRSEIHELPTLSSPPECSTNCWTETVGPRAIEIDDTPDSNSKAWQINNDDVVVGSDSLMMRTNVLIRPVDQHSMDGGMK